MDDKMQIQLDRSNNHPLYLQIVKAIRDKIEGGVLQSQTRLPASRNLAKQLGVNRITVVNAYAELTAEGLLESQVGRGTFVADVALSDASWLCTPLATTWQASISKPTTYNWHSNDTARDLMKLAQQLGIISFASGTVASEFLPVLPFRKALNDVLRRDGAAAMQYEEPIGYYPLRQIIAAYLSQRNLAVTADDILITDGCQQALDLVLRLVGRERDTVLVENPSYLGLLDIIHSHRMTPIGVPTDEDGLVVEQIEPLILRFRPQLIYLSPNFQNPTGRTTSLARREALLALAHKYNLLILEDDISRELYFTEPPPPSLANLDQGPQSLVFYASSYSKILMPGLRLGYLIAPPAMQNRISVLKQTMDISSSALNQRALALYLGQDYGVQPCGGGPGTFTAHLEAVRQAYQSRAEVMLDALLHDLPTVGQWSTPQGGLYLWGELPADGPSASDLYLKAIECGTAFAIGSVFFAHQPSQHSLRLNFACHTSDEIREGIRRLSKAWQMLTKQEYKSYKDVQLVMPLL